MDANDIKTSAKVTADTAHQNGKKVVSAIISELTEGAITYHEIISKINNIRNLDIEMLSELVNSICEYHDPRSVVNHQNSDGFTVLHCLVMLSAKMNNDNYIERLLDCDGINVNLTYKNNSALMIAAKSCTSDIVRMLLEKGADARMATNTGTTALDIAIESKIAIKVRHLIDPKLGAMTVPDEHLETVMTLVSKNKDWDLLRFLIHQNPSSIDTRDNEGHTAVMNAVEMNNDIARWLITIGADVNIKNKYNDTALTIALENNNTEIVKKLLTRDDTEAPHIYNQKLHGVYTRNFEIFDLLASNKRINPNLQDSEGNTVLMEFAKSCDSDDIDKLLDQEVNVNISDNDGNTALIFAARCGSAEVLSKLLAIEQIGINMTNKNGVSALMYAARRSRKEYIISKHEGPVIHCDQNVKCLRLLLDHPEIKCSFKDIISVFLSCDLGVISTFIGNRFYSMCSWFSQMMKPIVAFAKSTIEFCMSTINPAYQWLAQKVKSICHWHHDSGATTGSNSEPSSKFSDKATTLRESDVSADKGSNVDRTKAHPQSMC